MAELGNGTRRFDVHYSAVIGEKLKRIHRRAAREGRGPAVTLAFRKIIQRLELAPQAAGEALYRLPNLQLQVRTIVERPLLVEFGVAEQRPIVFIKNLRLLAQPGK